MNWKILAGAAFLGGMMWLPVQAPAAGPTGLSTPNIEGLSPLVDVHRRRYTHRHCYRHRHSRRGHRHTHCYRHRGGGGITIIIGI